MRIAIGILAVVVFAFAQTKNSDGPPLALLSAHPGEHGAYLVSVKEFGALGDGITDDTGAIQSAISSAGAVFLPAGVYHTTHPITLPPGATLMGESRDLSVVALTGTGAAFQSTNREPGGIPAAALDQYPPCVRG